MEIKYTCSLGMYCHSSEILKRNKIKKCSYPFDWILSNCDNIIHCLEDNFKTFLDKSFYINIRKTMCGHSYYNKRMFNHHNPLRNENDYSYYERCVDRFKKLVKYEEHKLFIMIFINNEYNIDESFKNNIIEFNNIIFKTYI